MVKKIKASTLLNAEASLSHLSIPSKTCDLGAPAHPSPYQLNKEYIQK